tara:strand:+ start:1009 stop:1164 length:156 start_codon:yes stop_codon:yes gene_type:complete
MIEVFFEDGMHVRSEHGVSLQIGRVIGEDRLKQILVLVVVEDFVAVVNGCK